ncbi:MAG: tRNA (guanosine(46)-N7)-methyltransferase TrmB [Oligoflexia bacterium]|nr:tRNA (guanosine(46)-N7)-methyltransferase TrmB [Oligoflexia bacterium]
MNKCDHTFLSHFVYSNVRDNPYHHKLGEYSHFVYRDHDGENFKGIWNRDAFNRNAPIHLDVGCGYGDFLIHSCQKNPHINYIGLDYRFKRGHQVAKKLASTSTTSSTSSTSSTNYKFLRAKGERLGFLFAENEVENIYLFFPDPWPKLRHHKKRIFNQYFLTSLHTILKPGGRLFFKTDHDGYFKWALEHVKWASDLAMFKPIYKSYDLWGDSYVSAYADNTYEELTNFKTKFEKIFISQETKIKALVIESLKLK